MCVCVYHHGRYKPVDNATAQAWRQHYYGAIAWMDSQVGRLLDELEDLNLHNDTMVGWGEW